jgi:hypothetical protein
MSSGLNLSYHEFKAGHGTIGTTAARAGVGIPVALKVIIKADLANGNNIYVGHDSSVSGTNGFTLDAGEFVEIEIDSLDKIWVVGGAADQGYSWIAI